MEYTINYSPQYNKKYPMKRRKNTRRTLGIWLSIMAVIICLWGVKNRSMLQKLLLPANSNDTQQAVTAFVEDIKSGKAFQEAATNFCQNILNNAEIELQDSI